MNYYILVYKLLSILHIDNHQLKSVSRARIADGDAKYLIMFYNLITEIRHTQETARKIT